MKVKGFQGALYRVAELGVRQDWQADIRELVNYIKDDPELIGNY